jgi:hypothetical protein
MVACRQLDGCGIPRESGDVNFRFRERLARARRRARAYLLFRRTPALRGELLGEAAALRAEAVAVDGILAEAVPESPG